jgi:hypothetical protein
MEFPAIVSNPDIRLVSFQRMSIRTFTAGESTENIVSSKKGGARAGEPGRTGETRDEGP